MKYWITAVVLVFSVLVFVVACKSLSDFLSEIPQAKIEYSTEV